MTNTTRKRLPIEDAVSAGGVVWRRNGTGEIDVVLCGRKDGVWGLHKGTPDDGESIEATAIREVQEETGLLVETGHQIGSIEYWFTADGVRYHKVVHHWLMTAIGGDVSLHDHEFDYVEWVDAPRAMELLSYANEKRILREALELLGET